MACATCAKTECDCDVTLTATEAKQSFAQRLSKIADRARNIPTRMGLRPYRVFMVWETFASGERGAGRARELARVELLPVPEVVSLDNVALRASEAGVVRLGMLQLKGVSTCSYTRDQLEGHTLPVEAQDTLPANVVFRYEIVEDGRGDAKPTRDRFRLAVTPHRDTNSIDWRITLERVGDDAPRKLVT
jgi:hypothetical protein